MSTLRVKQIVKQQQVLKIQNTLVGVCFLLLVSYSDLKVADFQSLRQDLVKIGSGADKVSLKVYKNTLLKRAIKDTVWKKLDNFIKGASFLVYSSQNHLSVIKKVFQFTKNHKKVIFQIGFFEGGFISASNLQQLALLPSRKWLLVKMIAAFQNPLCQLIYTLKKIYVSWQNSH